MIDTERFISGPDGWQCKDCRLYSDLCVCDDPHAPIRQTVAWPTHPVWSIITVGRPAL